MRKDREMYGEVQRILYEPLSWIHPHRFPLIDNFSSVRCQSVLNDILLDEFNLSIEGVDLKNSREVYVIAHWALLPSAALMATCHRHRSSLARTSLITKLDKATQQFVYSCLIESEGKPHDELSLKTLSQLACQEAIAFSCSLSLPIRERVPLLFASSPTTLDTGAYNNTDELLLRMAIQHAKYTP